MTPSGGTLHTTLTARDAGCNGNTQNNQLLALRVTRLDERDGGRAGGGTLTAPSATPIALPSHPPTLGLTVHRVTSGQASMVELTVTDGCGDWPTFLGGGPSAF